MHIYKRRSLESVYSWELCLQTVCCRRPFHGRPHGCRVKPPHDTPGRAAPSGPGEASTPCWGGYSPFSRPCERMPGTTTPSPPLTGRVQGRVCADVQGTPGRAQRGAGSGRHPCEGRPSRDCSRGQSLVPPAAVMPP
ncbi:unnamed protein product [Rangifer tarandus platyrhynchus]|uniref:Uncharacterized protein n=1 Tax=Rangifer tarandus platyrhynchus TaxID=3082113 RepID=A0ABN8ZIJ1_RANTA|nr:unnamed protein product [Rangifer tarandus platyrhynchus]